jgi:PadR family transcriptional regulator, regulatory protein AphA
VATAVKLTPTSAITVGHFWTFQHAQLYTETERLAKAGLLRVDVEEGGRRRKRYALTAAGRKALDAWRAEPATEVAELRDLGVLKLFLGAEPKSLGAAQLDAHQAKLREYEEIRKIDTGLEPRGPWIALESGIEHERQMIRFWKRLAEGE